MSYEQVATKARAFGAGLLTRGLQPGPDARIGVYSGNSPDYSIGMQVKFLTQASFYGQADHIMK
jgi:long-subunit acyl-CoA synthetase (AMP-forming)